MIFTKAGAWGSRSQLRHPCGRAPTNQAPLLLPEQGRFTQTRGIAAPRYLSCVPRGRHIAGVGASAAVVHTALSGREETDMSAPSQEEITPNQYHLQGGGISVSYYPGGSGPIIEGRGRLRFTYHDSFRALSFFGDEVRTVDVPDLGTVVSVTIVQTIDTGSTSASLLVPNVVLPSPLPVSINTELVTTRHLFFVVAFGHPQRDVYSVTALTGVASAGELPL
ncbi:MAG: hypothetical protein JWP55_944 [Mycobacterium sp.]|nr:hypothetical protein [Mycobacterium sp.]